MSELHDAIRRALMTYRCEYTVADDDEDGCSGLDLVDVLSPGPTIQTGEAEIGLLTDAIADAVDATGRPTIPPPSACRDPERLALIRPETVERWLRGRGWKLHWSSLPGRPIYSPINGVASRRGGGACITVDPARLSCEHLEEMAHAEDCYQGQVLAELEAMQTGEDDDE